MRCNPEHPQESPARAHQAADVARTPPSGRAGFTLIELLVVSLILALTVAAIGACLAGGLRVWDAARRFGAVESEGILALHAVSADLRNTFRFSAAGFEGGPDSVTFPALVRLQGLEDPELGTITYTFQRADGSLQRRTTLFKTAREETDIVAQNVVGFELIYIVDRDPGNPGVSAWNKGTTNLPDHVQVTLTVAEDASQAPFRLQQRVPLAAGGDAP